MCRTVHAVLQIGICGIQMLVRVFMTVILMLENLIRMILQTLYNFISFILQMVSLIPICVVFLVTARLKCFMCGGGGPCPVNRGGACDCLMSAVAIIIMFFIFRATGVLDKIFYSLGYTKARPMVYAFVPTPGDITECSRNDTDYPDESTEPFGLSGPSEPSGPSDPIGLSELYASSESYFSSTQKYDSSDRTEFYTSTILLPTAQTSEKTEESSTITSTVTNKTSATQTSEKTGESSTITSTVTNKISATQTSEKTGESSTITSTVTEIASDKSNTEIPPAA